MTRAERLTYLLISFTMFLATTALAANKCALHVHSTAMVGERQLPAGEYTVQWEGAGPDVELKIILHDRVIAEVPAKVIPLDQPPREDAAALGTGGAGGRKLLEIRVSGKKFFLQIAPQTASVTLSQQPSRICPHCQPAFPW